MFLFGFVRQQILRVTIFILAVAQGYLVQASQSGVMICSDQPDSLYEDQYMVIEKSYFLTYQNWVNTTDMIFTGFVLDHDSGLGQTFLHRRGKIPTYCQGISFSSLAKAFPWLEKMAADFHAQHTTDNIPEYTIFSISSPPENVGVSVRSKHAFKVAIAVFAVTNLVGVGYPTVIAVASGLACYFRHEDCERLMENAVNTVLDLLSRDSQPRARRVIARGPVHRQNDRSVVPFSGNGRVLLEN